VVRGLIIIVVGIAIYLFLRWLKQQPAKVRWQYAAAGLGLGLVILAATGRLHWLAALFGALLPFARRLIGLVNYLPLVSRLMSQYKSAQASSAPNSGSSSQVQSRYLRMSLDHDSGDMSGEVLEGYFKGRQLNEMSLEELLALYAECRTNDQESTALLRAYMDRIHGENWHDQVDNSETQDTRSNAPQSGNMSRTEAFEILGLSPEASQEEIIEAHRRLIQKLHPDRGGSTYLAAKINQAKDMLLE
jgi:hypothetical protein